MLQPHVLASKVSLVADVSLPVRWSVSSSFIPLVCTMFRKWRKKVSLSCKFWICGILSTTVPCIHVLSINTDILATYLSLSKTPSQQRREDPALRELLPWNLLLRFRGYTSRLNMNNICVHVVWCVQKRFRKRVQKRVHLSSCQEFALELYWRQAEMNNNFLFLSSSQRSRM